jgi:hypothetical protein
MAFDNPNDMQMAFLISHFRMKKERNVDLLFFIFKSSKPPVSSQFQWPLIPQNGNKNNL